MYDIWKEIQLLEYLVGFKNLALDDVVFKKSKYKYKYINVYMGECFGLSQLFYGEE